MSSSSAAGRAYHRQEHHATGAGFSLRPCQCADYLQNGQQPEQANFVAALTAGADSASAARANSVIFMSGSFESGAVNSAPLAPRYGLQPR